MKVPNSASGVTLAAASFLLLAAPVPNARAEEPVKIGLMLSLSGTGAVLSEQARDGFNLAIDELQSKMGGRTVEVIVKDDEMKPDVAVVKARELVQRDGVNFVVGPIYSNVAAAIHKPITEADVILISPNAGPSVFAGSRCHPNFFVSAYQNDQVHEVMGKVAEDRGYKRVYLLAPNYQAGKDALAGFKRHFKGEIVEESYVPLTTLDFQDELAKISSLKPDALFTLMPGGLGVNLVIQYRQAGLAESTTFLSAFTIDEATLPAQQDAALGLFGGTNWAANIDNPANKAFVDSFEGKYHYPPSVYSAMAYDAAKLIASALKTTKGRTSDKDALRSAIRDAKFMSVRGKFRFNINGFPIQDFILTQAVKRPDGKFRMEAIETVFRDYGDVYAKDCKPSN